jgi:hypothetical protein
VGLSLLVPAFLIGLAVVVVPILVHLRQRERKEPIRFPSLMFLRQVPHRTVERRRLTHRLLLLLRGLAVALLVAAFARPFFERDDDRPMIGTARRAVVIAVDRSMSMGYRGVWERARDSARAVIARLSPGDRAALIAFDETAEVMAPLSQDLAGVSAALGGLRPTGRGTRLPPAMRLAAELAAGQRGSEAEIVLISDLQRSAAVGLESVERPFRTGLRIVSVTPEHPGNARVAGAEVDQQAEGRRARVSVSARIATKADSGWSTKASLLVGGRELATAAVRLKPNSIQTVRFDPVWIPATEATAVVALGPDALVADDSLRFTLGVATGVTVVLLLPPVMGAEESLYLERALAISRSPALTVATRRATTVSAADLDRAAAVVIADGTTLPAAAVGRLASFVDRGGGVVVFEGRRGTPSNEVSRWLPAAVGKVIDRAADRGGRLGQLDPDHPAFEPFKDAIASDFGSVRFFRYRDLAPDSNSVVLGRFDDGRPAIVEKRGGPGRVVVIAAPADAAWSDLPLQPVFLPLVQRLVVHAAGLVATKRWFAVGEVGAVPPEPRSLTVIDPSGATTRISGDSARTVVFTEPGIYRATADAATAPVARFAVNTAEAESDLGAISGDEVAMLVRPARDSTGAGSGPRLSGAEQERAQSWWIILLAAAVLLLAAEAWYAGRLQAGGRVLGGAR